MVEQTTEQSPDRRLEQLARYVEADVATEWQRKSGLDTKSLGLITANLGITTLSFAVRSALGLAQPKSPTAAHGFQIGSLTLLAVSILLAGVAALPNAYTGTKASTVKTYLEYLVAHTSSDHSEVDTAENLLSGRVQDLAAAQHTNNVRAALVLAGFLALAAAAACLIVVLSLSPTAS